ncbi:NUDIX hydrolase [Teredinibacter franksiae]|jgi:NUDIX domain.|uniref:NUDIX hydrolase n=1 Tax=Teredinibacter franksiae TaxID=2761453 RepID=UPI00162388D7|nr:CoA pyrophosphatase [Teredinibacter franksiae]
MSKAYNKQAAVLLAVSDKPTGEEEVLLTLRAAHLSSHSGEVAFPGGKWEPGDCDLCFTALREASEEVGLEPGKVKVLAELKPSYTRMGTRVTPFVGRVPANSRLEPNPEELTDLFWFPLSILKADRRVRTDVFVVGGREYWAPVYEYAGFTIWGFTARVLVDFLACFYNITLTRNHHEAPEVIR